MNEDSNEELVEQPSTSQDQPDRNWLKYVLFRIVRFTVFAYAAIIIFLVVSEPSLVYPGSPYPRGNWEPTDFEFEEAQFLSSDGTNLVGWYLPKEGATETVLLCHGNAENCAQSAAYIGEGIRIILNANVFVYDYRGYGKSEGKPFEKGILEDSTAAMMWLNEKTNTSPDDIIVVGHSIGGGPACYLAGEHGAKLLVLQRTFCSLVDAAQTQYPFVPVSLLMRNRYPSDERVAKYNGPVFQSHGTADNVVAYESGRRLFEACPGEHKKFFEMEGTGHYDPLPNQYWRELKEFVEGLN